MSRRSETMGADSGCGCAIKVTYSAGELIGADVVRHCVEHSPGAQVLGEVVAQQNAAVLEATGLHTLIGPDGDGDWASVWESLADLKYAREDAWEEGLIAGAEWCGARPGPSGLPSDPPTNPYAPAPRPGLVDPRRSTKTGKREKK